MKIKLSNEEIEFCLEFSKKCAKNQQDIEFGQHDTKARSKSEIARDNLIGKLAEVAFASFLQKNYNITAQLDFEYYPRGVWDGQDVEINSWRIDVKGTRPGAEWLLVEWNKLNFRKKENRPSHVYVMAIVGWDRKNDIPNGEVELIGYAYLEQLNNNISGTYILRKGKKLPGKNVYLQADNYGIPFRLLKKDWSALINKMQSSSPSM